MSVFSAGEVLLDGHNIRSLQLKWYREQIGLVNQEPALFATTIRANILYGKENGTAEEIEKAAKAANAHGFIVQLPHAYDTQVRYVLNYRRPRRVGTCPGVPVTHLCSSDRLGRKVVNFLEARNSVLLSQELC